MTNFSKLIEIFTIADVDFIVRDNEIILPLPCYAVPPSEGNNHTIHTLASNDSFYTMIDDYAYLHINSDWDFAVTSAYYVEDDEEE